MLFKVYDLDDSDDSISLVSAIGIPDEIRISEYLCLDKSMLKSIYPITKTDFPFSDSLKKYFNLLGIEDKDRIIILYLQENTEKSDKIVISSHLLLLYFKTLKSNYIFDENAIITFSNMYLLEISNRKQSVILDYIAENYSKKFSNERYNIENVIMKVIPKLLSCESVTLFTINPYSYKFEKALLNSNDNKKESSFLKGEGVLGEVVENNKAIIINKNNGNFSKNTPIPGKDWENERPFSFMAIPIKNFSNFNEVIGVIRFINKINSFTHKKDNFFKRRSILCFDICRFN